MHCGTWRRGGVLSHTCEPQPGPFPPCRDTSHMLLEVGQHISCPHLQPVLCLLYTGYIIHVNPSTFKHLCALLPVKVPP